MRAVFVFFTLAFIAATFAATHEETVAEATEFVEAMKKKGATAADCKDLAKTTCKEVLDEVNKDQKVIDSQSTGAERVKQWTISKKTITKYANYRINLGTKTFISLKA